MSRLAHNWLHSFVAYTDPIESPVRFRLWTAIATIAATLERRTWTVIKARPLYPNQYVILVGGPGVGKSNAITEGSNFMRRLKLHIPAVAITKEKLFILMSEKYTRQVINGVNLEITSPITIVSNEFGVTLRKTDADFMTVLTDMWDAPHSFDYDTKSGGPVHIENPMVNLLAGTTPTWIASNLPAYAFEMGFAARLFFVFESTPIRSPLNRVASMNPELEEALARDLKEVFDLRGEFVWTDEAFDHLEAWYNEGMLPIPQETLLQNYVVRRLPHLGKIAMAVSAAKRSDLMITLEDVVDAQQYMLDAETVMGTALEAVGQNPYNTAVRQAIKYVEAATKPVPDYELIRQLTSHIHPSHMTAVLETLVSSRMVLVEMHAERRYFRPLPPSLRPQVLSATGQGSLAELISSVGTRSKIVGRM